MRAISDFCSAINNDLDTIDAASGRIAANTNTLKDQAFAVAPLDQSAMDNTVARLNTVTARLDAIVPPPGA